MKELTDDDPMPFGKYKGIRMMDVPASYLHFLWQDGLKRQTKISDVAAYIKQSMRALKEEHPDGIWD